MTTTEATSSSPGDAALARNWGELVETMHGGLAVLDANGRWTYVSERFLSVLGTPEDLVGHKAHDVLPALTHDDPRQLRQQLDAGKHVVFEQRCAAADGEEHCYRLTAVASSALGDDLHAVVFAEDITAMSQRLDQIRDATTDLTEVENHRRRRISRDVHDGPVQLLAALAIRLGMSSSDTAKELQQVASDVASSLRTVIDDFSPAIDRTGGEQFEEWIAPLLVGTGLEISVHDDRVETSGLAEAQAAFVLLYQTVRALRDSTTERTITMRISDEHGGERINLTMRSKPPLVITGEGSARLEAIAHHAQTLGGTLAHSLDDHNLRTVSMWIPKLTHLTTPPKQPTTPSRISPSGPQNDLTRLPQMTDSVWQDIVRVAPEQMAELDDQLRVTYANEMMIAGTGLPLHDVIGMTSQQMLELGVIDPGEDRGRLLRRLQAGERIETHWHRTDALGESRRIRLTLSPRFDPDGQWQGLFVANDDRQDIDSLDLLYQTALADLTLARRLATERSVRLLAEPLAKIDDVVDLIGRFAPDSPDPEAMRKIRTALATSLQSIRNSSNAFTTPSMSITDIDGALRESLGMLLDSCDLVVMDTIDGSPPRDLTDIVFRIAREAVNNAVLHGRADTVTVTLDSVDDGVRCTIHDNGIGITPSDLEHQPGHLGTRSMQARARERGGTCRIEPHSVVGTIVDVWLPNGPHRQSGQLAADVWAASSD